MGQRCVGRTRLFRAGIQFQRERHPFLHIRGQAFESDLKFITRLAEKDWRVTAEFGHQHQGDHKHLIVRDQLRLLRMDNHVDPETQTFSFYLPLENEVVQDLGDGDQTVFRQWQFKPGQRVHLRIPVERWEQQMKLPIDAVAVEGPNAIVFREHHHHGGETAIELEPFRSALVENPEG